LLVVEVVVDTVEAECLVEVAAEAEVVPGKPESMMPVLERPAETVIPEELQPAAIRPPKV
jgi:hypothetical protein